MPSHSNSTRPEILAPAGNADMLCAAVFAGADAVYLGLQNFNARRTAGNFTTEGLRQAVAFCHARDVRVYVTLNTTLYPGELTALAEAVAGIAAAGADAVITQDLAVAALVRRMAPGLALHGSTQMSVQSLDGARRLAALGFTRVILARELTLSEIAGITAGCGIETETFVHGALCMSVSGQCYMSALIGRRSGNRGACAQPCRMQYSMGGRMDEYPLSLRDNCLADYLQQLADAGVACVKIEGRMKRPEYVAVVTDVYARCIHEHRVPTQEENDRLALAFSRQGFTQGYLLGKKGPDMLGTRAAEPDREAEKMFTAARKAYADGERRRVPVKFYAKVQTGEPVMAAVMDEEGHRAVLTGPVPEPAQRAPLTAQSLADQFAKTGGTPYYSTGTESRIDPDLYLPAAAVNDLRRRLITGLKEERAALPERRSLPLLPRPEGKRYFADPALIVQVHQAEQLTQELAALHPAYVYVPVEILDSDFPRLAPFLEQGAQVTAVLPRVITDDQAEDMHAMLSRAAENGVQEALVGNMGHIFFARRAGMRVRGDFGLNVFNSFTEEVLQQAGLVSATASFELRVAQIRDLAKSIDTEMIVYGRLPCMITEQCIIRNSAGRCNCSVPNNLADRRGALFPVLPAFGHRNQIFNAHKLYLADKHEDYETAGLWGVRLMFTTETPRECVAVTQSYLGLTDYRPNGLTRGLYYRGVE